MPGQFGYHGEVMTLQLPVGSQVAVQALFLDVGALPCVAASNALVLTVQQ